MILSLVLSVCVCGCMYNLYVDVTGPWGGVVVKRLR